MLEPQAPRCCCEELMVPLLALWNSGAAFEPTD